MYSHISAASAAAVATYGRPDAHEVDGAVYDEALGAVPPIYGAGDSVRQMQFWLGESYNYDARGRTIALEFWQTGTPGGRVQYWCRLSVAASGELPAN